MGFALSAQAGPAMFQARLGIISLGTNVSTSPAVVNYKHIPVGYQCGPQLGSPCAPSVVQNGKPLTGSGTASLMGSAPAGFTIPAGILAALGTGSIPPLGGVFIDWFTYKTSGDLRNGAGSFKAGSGPGAFTFFRGTPRTGVASVSGGSSFGGVMKLLGTLSWSVGGFSRYFTPYLTFKSGGPLGAAFVAGGNPMNTGISPWYRSTIPGGYFSTRQVYNTGFPWTTGMAIAFNSTGFPTYVQATGYDNRTALGLGTIQLVTPMLAHYFGFGGYSESSIAILNLKFVPEPSAVLMLAVGAGVLALLYRFHRRS
jgi:hypothetical protein